MSHHPALVAPRPLVKPRSASPLARSSRASATAARRARRRAGTVLLFVGLAGAYLHVAMADDELPFGALTTAYASQAESPTAQAAYPLMGSSALVRHLESAMIAQVAAIDVTPWAGNGGDARVREAAAEAWAVNPAVLIDGWRISSVDGATLLHPAYLPADAEADAPSRR